MSNVKFAEFVNCTIAVEDNVLVFKKYYHLEYSGENSLISATNSKMVQKKILYEECGNMLTIGEYEKNIQGFFVLFLQV